MRLAVTRENMRVTRLEIITPLPPLRLKMLIDIRLRDADEAADDERDVTLPFAADDMLAPLLPLFRYDARLCSAVSPVTPPPLPRLLKGCH